MSAWECMVCHQPTESGLPSFLVVEGTFGNTPTARVFNVEHSCHETLCRSCHAKIKDFFPFIPVKVGKLPCAGCGADLAETAQVWCEECSKVEEPEQPHCAECSVNVTPTEERVYCDRCYESGPCRVLDRDAVVVV